MASPEEQLTAPPFSQNGIPFHDNGSSAQGFEATLWLRKGFGFSGPWSVREQNRLLAFCFGLPQVNKA